MNSKSLISLLGLLAALVLGAGCATPIQPAAMTPKSFEVQQRHAHTVAVAVQGGEKTDPMYVSTISGENFAQAVSDAIAQSGLFSAVLRDGIAEYQLHILIANLNQPKAGFDMTATMSTHWKLTRKSDNKVVFEDFVASTFKATVGDAFAAVTRVRLVAEGVARENIKEGIRRLSAATF